MPIGQSVSLADGTLIPRAECLIGGWDTHPKGRVSHWRMGHSSQGQSVSLADGTLIPRAECLFGRWDTHPKGRMSLWQMGHSFPTGTLIPSVQCLTGHCTPGLRDLRTCLINYGDDRPCQYTVWTAVWLRMQLGHFIGQGFILFCLANGVFPNPSTPPPHTHTPACLLHLKHDVVLYQENNFLCNLK